MSDTVLIGRAPRAAQSGLLTRVGAAL